MSGRDGREKEVGEVRKPVGHGVSIFSKMAGTSERLCELPMPEEPVAGGVPLRDDIKAKLLLRQAGLRRDTTSTAADEKKKDHKPVQPMNVVSDASTSTSPSSASSLDGSAASSRVRVRSTEATSSDDDSFSSSNDDSMASASDSTRSLDGDDDDRSSSSASDDGPETTMEDDTAKAFSSDFLSFDSAPTMATAAKATKVAGSIPHGLPAVSGLDDLVGYDPAVFAVVNYTFSDGSVGPLAIPHWSVPRFQRSGRLYCTTNTAVALHEEVTDLFDWLRPTEAEVVMRRLIEVEMSDIARDLWPGCTPCAFGSLSTHLMLPTSDVDMTVLDVAVHTEDALLALCKAVAANKLCATAWPQMILKTKVPLVKFATRLGNVEVDVSVNAGDGKTNSEVVRALCSRFPEAKVLIPIVKYFLAQRDMNEPFRGTLGSFCTTLLVLSFLQLHPIYTTHPHLRAQYGLGRLLVEFFRYYALSFNFHRVGLSLAQGGSCFLRPQSGMNDGPRGPGQVLVEDPGNSANNVASSLRYFQNIRTAFDGAYHALSAPPGVTKLTSASAADPAVVRPTAPQSMLRSTLLSRVINSDASVSKRRGQADAAFAEFQASEDPEKVERVLAHKRDEDLPLLELPQTTPLSKVSETYASLASRVPEPNEGVFAPAMYGGRGGHDDRGYQASGRRRERDDNWGRGDREQQRGRPQPPPPPPVSYQQGESRYRAPQQQHHQQRGYQRDDSRHGGHRHGDDRSYGRDGGRGGDRGRDDRAFDRRDQRGGGRYERGGGGGQNAGGHPQHQQRDHHQHQHRDHQQQRRVERIDDRGGQRGGAPRRYAGASSSDDDDGGTFGNWTGGRRQQF